ncbi:transmembrane protein 177 [Osmia bicornis bicornis]|uniref:transmembrane protein 177 n=1 Tax=Osmia bicornis bicornis TaxID=1437191 RepID=UPI0010F78C9A|nr:transmembrane protein 177 [Osmia bicornis bicornis]
MRFRPLLVGAIVSVNLLPNTIFLDKYRKFRATYGFDGNERPVPDKIKKRFREVINDLKLSEEDRNKIQIFSVHDINIFHAGTLLGLDAIIGIPPNYAYESTESLSADQVKIENKDMLWNEETSKNFLESLVLSENAQKFAIARAILKVKRPEFWIKQVDTIIDCMIFFLIYDTFKIAVKSRIKLKILVYAINGIIAFGAFLIWAISEQLIDVNADKSISYELAELDPKYVQGGKEYYEKLCQRDNVLRPYFTKTSKFFSWINKREASPFTQSKFFDSKLYEMNGEEHVSSNVIFQ